MGLSFFSEPTTEFLRLQFGRGAHEAPQPTRPPRHGFPGKVRLARSFREQRSRGRASDSGPGPHREPLGNPPEGKKKMSNLFQRAADIIRENHNKGAYADLAAPPGGISVCMEGALRLAVLRQRGGCARASSLVAEVNFCGLAYNETCHLATILPDCDGTCREAMMLTYNDLPVVVDSTLADLASLPADAPRRVHHYNDWHCDGGAEAARWLEKAGESWEQREQ